MGSFKTYFKYNEGFSDNKGYPFSFGLSNILQSTTANLRNHLKRKHIGTYSALVEEKSPEIRSRAEDVPADLSQPSNSRAAAQTNQILVPPPAKKAQKIVFSMN